MSIEQINWSEISFGVTKNPKRKESGGKATNQGIQYEILYNVNLLLDLINDYNLDFELGEIEMIRRGVRNSYVDDFIIKTKKGKSIYVQAKTNYTSSDWKNEVLPDFLNQIKQDKGDCILYLVSEKGFPALRDLCVDAKRFSYIDFYRETSNNNELVNLQLNITNHLKVENKDVEENIVKNLTYSLLYSLHIVLFDNNENSIKTKASNTGNYPKHLVHRLYNLLETQASKSWFQKDVYKSVVKKELENQGFELSIKAEGNNISVPIEIEGISFQNELSSILETIGSLNNISQNEVELYVNQISHEGNNLWHFVKNLKDPSYLNNLERSLTKMLSSSTGLGTKFRILDYLEKCIGVNDKIILSILGSSFTKLRNTDLISRYLEVLGKLSPRKKKQKENIERQYRYIATHQDVDVRTAIAKSLRDYSEYNLGFALETLQELITSKVAISDKTKGGMSLRLTFSGKDRHNHFQNEVINTLVYLMEQKDSALNALTLTIEVEKNLIDLERGADKSRGIIEDGSYIWLDRAGEYEELEYMNDIKERIPLEIARVLKLHIENNPQIVKNLVETLLSTKQEVFFLSLVSAYQDITEYELEEVKRLLLAPNLYKPLGVRRYRLQNLITRVLSDFPEFKSEFLSFINKTNWGGKEFTNKVTLDVLAALPKESLSNDEKHKIADLEKNLKLKASTKPLFAIRDASFVTPNIKDEDIPVDIDSLIELIDKFKSDFDYSFRIHENVRVIAEKTKGNKKLLQDVITSENKLGKDIVEAFISANIEHDLQTNSNIEKIILSLIPYIDLTYEYRSSRIKLARKLEEQLRELAVSEETTIQDSTLRAVLNALKILSADEDPIDDGSNIKSNNPRPEDAITRAINSVRGISVEATVRLLHKYPDNKEIQGIIKEFEKDKVKSVVCNLIYCLRFINGRNYSFAKGVVLNDKYKYTSDPGLAFALLHFYARLNKKQFNSNMDNINNLFHIENSDIQSILGELYAYRVIADFGVEEVMDKIMSDYFGSDETRRSIAFVFESYLNKLYEENNDSLDIVLLYLNRLTDPNNETSPKVRERAAFLFRRKDISLGLFTKLVDSGIVDNIISDTGHMPAQSSLLDYLIKNIEANQNVIRSMELLHRLCTESNVILYDSFTASKVASIIRHENVTIAHWESVQEFYMSIYSDGLRIGFDSFYDVFQNHKK